MNNSTFSVFSILITAGRNVPYGELNEEQTLYVNEANALFEKLLEPTIAGIYVTACDDCDKQCYCGPNSEYPCEM